MQGLNRLTFTGREYDPDVQMYQFRARWYDPYRGRFISRDPAWPESGINPYEYAESNPISGIDPLGLDTSDNLLMKVEAYQPEIDATLEEFKQMNEGKAKDALRTKLLNLYRAQEKEYKLARAASSENLQLNAIEDALARVGRMILFLSRGSLTTFFFIFNLDEIMSALNSVPGAQRQCRE